MFISILILILFLSLAFLPLELDSFSPNELSKMSISLGNSETINPLPIAGARSSFNKPNCPFG
jgi:hypothetical protein